MRTVLAAVLVMSTTASAFELKRDSAGDPAAWKSEVRFVVDAKLSKKLEVPGAEDAVAAALKTVGAAIPALKLSQLSGTPQGMGYDFDNPSKSTSDVVAPDEWKYNVDAVATTVITITRSTHQIIEADIAFNVKHTAFTIVGATPESARFDVQNTMTHELGHALGLAHNDLPATVMYPSGTPGDVSKRALADDDIQGLQYLYGAAAAVTPEEVTRGCSATGSAPFAMLAVLLVAVMRKKRAAMALAAVLGAVVFVAPSFASTQLLKDAWTVSAVTTLPPGKGSTVLESEVTVIRDGVAHTVRVLGGRWGDLEQIVEGFAVPYPGDELRAFPRATH